MKNHLNYIVTGKLTERELNRLSKDLSVYDKDRVEALVAKDYKGGKDLSVRNSTLFFPSVSDFPKTFNILQSAIIYAYHNTCSYIDLSNISEIQYARYDEGCFFKRHTDSIYIPGTNSERTLTFSINMSDPSEYDGGELVVFDKEENEIAALSKEIGSYIIFPSVFLHEAKEVTRGIRRAIVCWIHAPHTIHKKFVDELYKID